MNDTTKRDEAEKADPVKRIVDGIADGLRVFVVRGAAGTGKTTLIGRLIPELDRRKFIVSLVAPTGRAAKMMQIRSGHPATTIHSAIYKIDDRPIAGTAENGDLKWIFELNPNRPVRTAFIVDESSMVGSALHNDGILQFGTGSLLQDLLGYVGVERPDSDNIIIFVGDPYQLPPVKEKAGDPPALDDGHLSGLTGCKVLSVELTEIHRQSKDSGILAEATRLRGAIAYRLFGSFAYRARPDIHIVSEDDIARLYHPEENLNEKIIISYTNARVWEFNSLVRRILGKTSMLPCEGERLLCLRNTQVAVSESREVRFMNGDMLQVLAVDDSRIVKLEGFYHPKGRSDTLRYEFTFCRMTVGWLYESRQEDADVWVNVTPLVSESYRDDPEYASVALYVAVSNRIREKLKADCETVTDEKIKEKLKISRLYHAPWVTFGYAITGHKSQGGEWREVWIDYRYSQNKMTEDYFRWMYTVTTRARSVLFAVAPPAFDDLAEALERGIARIPQTGNATPAGAALSLEAILGRYGCSVIETVKRQYALHFKLGRQDDPFAETGSLDINYNGKGVVSYVRLACLGAGDAFGREVAALKGRKMESVFPLKKNGPGLAESPVVEVESSHVRIADRLCKAAEKTGLSVGSAKSLSPHQLRLEISSDLGDGYVDFYVDGKGRVTEMGSMTVGAANLKRLLEGLAA